jgi:hypothetical protein
MLDEISQIYTSKKLFGEAELNLGPLPANVIAGDRVFYGKETNVFINDVPNFNSLEFLGGLRTSLGIIDSVGKSRNVEIWEADYLTERLAETLLGSVEDLNSRIIVTMTGCGEVTAKSLANKLSDDYGINLQIVSAADACQLPEFESGPILIVDDVLKTGGTISRELQADLLARPDNKYAVWAMSALSRSDYERGKQYAPLRALTRMGQQIIAGVVYAGAGLASPGLGLPVNSISTLVGDSDKSDSVLSSLANKYFGSAIYRAVGRQF